MKQTTFQPPEIRGADNTIITEGTYGRETPLVNSDNTGVLDYINNNLMYLYNNTMGVTGGAINTETITGKTGTITNLTATTVKAGTVTADALNGPLTGNVTGDLNGNVTGDVTGNLTGNVTGTADKAVADGNGNNIVNTYVTKSSLASGVTTGTGKVTTLTATDSTLTNLTVTGQTSVPTANAGNSSKAIANTEFVAKSLAALVNNAPDQLNTLNELATALGNDANFAATITAELAKKLNSAEAESTYATKQEAGVPYQIKRNTNYNVGDVLTSPSLPPGCVIVVTQAGTTGSIEPDWTTIKNNIGGWVVSDGTAQFKTVALYEDTEYHDYSTLTVTNGKIMEPTNTYWIKRGKWIYVNISGILTNDGTSQVYISGLPAPVDRVNVIGFSNRSHLCIGLFSVENGKFATLPTGGIEQIYTSFVYMI